MNKILINNISHSLRCVFLLLILALSDTGHAERTEDMDVVVLGDSNSWIGGDDCSKDVGWTKWFAEKFQPSTIRSYARSGATWTNTKTTKADTKSYSEILSDQNVIYNQALRLIEAVDSGKQPVPEVILIGAGANDAWFTTKRPNIFHDSVEDTFSQDTKYIDNKLPSDCLSLTSSIRLTCEMLMRAFPKSQIVLLTSPQITKCDYASQRKVNDLITECGRRMSINVISLSDGCGTYRIGENNVRTFTSDGVHNNMEGAKRTGCFVASQLKSILLF